MRNAITICRPINVYTTFVVLLLLLTGTPHCRAQEDPEPRENGSTPGYFLRTADGQLVPLSDFGVSKEDLDKLIRDKKVIQAPQFVLWSVKLTGEIRDKLAYIDATIRVQLTVDNRWVAVPIAMDDGKLTAPPKYKGEGRHLFDRATTARTGTRTWLFNGAGIHELTLPLVVSIREPQHLRYSLRLRLPETSSSELTLKVPDRTILVEHPRGSSFRRTAGESDTTIDVWGLGAQFALQWTVRPDVSGAKAFLRSQTNLTADLAKDPFAISARQTLIMQQGSADTFDITLPEGMLLRESAPNKIDPTGQISSAEVDEETGRVRIKLDKPLTDRLELRWSLVPRDLELTRRWKFNGFLVDGAQEQTTELELMPPDGVAIQEVKSVGIQKSRSLRSDQRLTRCRLLSPESQFVVELQDVEPFFTVAPRMMLFASEEQLRLEARFSVRVLRGSLQTLKLNWAHATTDGWKLLPTPPDEQLVQWTAAEITDTGTDLRLLSRQTGTFEIAVVAVRSLEKQNDFRVTLPDVAAQTRQDTTLAIATESNIEFQLADAEDTNSSPIPFDSRIADDFQRQTESLNTRALLVRSDERTFRGTLTAREQTVQTRSLAVLDVREDFVNVEQTISYDVRFGHLAELRCEVPELIEPTFALSDGTPLRRLSVGQSVSRFVLPEPITGTFDVQVRYRLPFVPGVATIPLVQSSDAAFSEFRLATQPDPAFRAEPIGDWQLVFSRDYEAEWISRASPTELQLNLTSPLVGLARKFSVERALVQTRVVGDVAESRINFVVRGRFNRQVLSVPENAVVLTVYWNARTVPPTEWQLGRDETGANVLTVQQSQNVGTGILSIDFRAPMQPLSWSRSMNLSAPQMPEDVPVSDVVWQVILATGEHLSGYAPSSTPCFEWQLGSFGWARKPTTEFSSLDTWLREGTARDTQVVRTVAGNAYAFQTPGLQSLRVDTFDQSLILLMGSGVAFLVAFAMLKIAPGRIGIVVPIAGLLLAVMSLRYAAALELLTQPVLVGILLAVLATWFDRRRAKRGYGPYGMTRDPRRNRPSAVELPGTQTAIAPSGSAQ